MWSSMLTWPLQIYRRDAQKCTCSVLFYTFYSGSKSLIIAETGKHAIFSEYAELATGAT